MKTRPFNLETGLPHCSSPTWCLVCRSWAPQWTSDSRSSCTSWFICLVLLSSHFITFGVKLLSRCFRGSCGIKTAGWERTYRSRGCERPMLNPTFTSPWNMNVFISPSWVIRVHLEGKARWRITTRLGSEAVRTSCTFHQRTADVQQLLWYSM